MAWRCRQAVTIPRIHERALVSALTCWHRVASGRRGASRGSTDPFVFELASARPCLTHRPPDSTDTWLPC
eukprot:920128-Amphidinium_carterae.1